MKRNQETRNKGTLYHKDMPERHGSVRFIERPKSTSEKLRKTIGAGITGISLALFIYSYGPLISQQLQPNNIKTPDTIVTTIPEVKAQENNNPVEKSFDYSINIPFLKTSAKILLNVDPANEGEYDAALAQGVAQAKGTGLPGDGERIFLFAHSTNSPLLISRFNALFYNLDKVPVGESILISNGDKTFTYKVHDKKIVSASDTTWIFPHAGEELILQTCWPAGTNWKRLLVFATPE